MAHLRERYKWMDDYDGKSLNLPTVPSSFIDINFDAAHNGNTKREHSQYHSALPFAISKCFSAAVIDVRQLVNRSDRNVAKTVYELTMKIASEVVSYQPGDTIGILPVNADDVVNDIINRNATLKAKSTLPITLKLSPLPSNTKKAPKMPIYMPTSTTTISKVLKETLDLNAIPKKVFLTALAKSNCVSDDDEKRFLEILASTEGTSIYVHEILQGQKSFYRLFGELKSMNFTASNIVTLFEHLPRLMPRPYSISSSPLAVSTLPEYDRHSTILRIIFSVNDPPGITTRMLEQFIFKYEVENTLRINADDEHINLYMRQNNRFRLGDDDFERPLIMIAIGTAVAPFIGFLEHRCVQKKKLKRTPGRTWLLFGCRQKANQLCRNELKAFLASGVLNRLSETFSRDQDGSHDRYVQDEIKAHADAFIELFNGDDESETKTFICGNRKMAQDVRATIEECLCKIKQFSAIDAKTTVDELIKNGRYVEDVWI